MTTADAPVLLACAHGTRSPAGRTAVQRLVDAVAVELPDVEVVPTWVDVQTPDLAERTEQYAGRPAVVVPLLLSAGYHVYVDVAEAVAADDLHRVSAALGPDRALARLLARRVHEACTAAGAPLGEHDAVVLATAGSSDRRAVADCATVAEQLAEELGHPVTVSYLAAARPRVAEAVADARAGLAAEGRVVVANYLLAPGYFLDLSRKAGADVDTEPLAVPEGEVPPELVDVVVSRYRSVA
ncbi:CbiX/SirB N-terminal domain-containing protein [Kocuria sp. CPCC 205268]|uniref:sirohydrochlorin chelatase n=1 Tax=Kocuria oxytropis TaxID=3058913 RepID=UPI0034D60F2C